MTLAEALRLASARLRDSDHPRLEAEVLLCLVLDKPRTHLVAWPESTLDTRQQTHFEGLLARRQAGEPLAYLTGEREFWSLPLRVSPDTLIPRPDTETLVERALELIPADAPWHIADLGTGCGAIALAIASERPLARLYACDRSKAALEIARDNTRRLGLDNLVFRQGSWCSALPPAIRFDLLLSNPPYIRDTDPHLMRGDLPWEPLQALASGADGLADIRRITAQAGSHLRRAGGLILEHDPDQGPAARAILAQHGFTHCATRHDLEQRPRISEGFLP
ncbi:MAG: peptide chain release factor N(5)-glutamine methyltransferase [gamma proteobacterium symbiont of Phacoides pectinatus]